MNVYCCTEVFKRQSLFSSKTLDSRCQLTAVSCTLYLPSPLCLALYLFALQLLKRPSPTPTTNFENMEHGTVAFAIVSHQVKLVQG